MTTLPDDGDGRSTGPAFPWRGSKRTEVGVIPQDWQVTLLPDICWFQEGPGVRAHEFTYTGVKLLNGTNIQNGLVRLGTTTRFISSSKANGPYKHFLIDNGDILLATSGVSIAKLDEKVAIARSEVLPLCMNTSTVRFKVRATHLLPEYFYYFLQCDLFKEQIGRQATGSAQLNFGPSHLAKVLFPIPPREIEQRAIAAALLDVDRLIAALDTLIAKKRAIKQAAMQQLLTGTIRLPGFDGEWEAKRFGDVFQFLPTANNSRADLSDYGSVKYVHYGDIHTGPATLLDCDNDRFPLIDAYKAKGIPFLEDGDLVIADASEDNEGIGKAVEVRNATGRRVIAGLHTILLRGDKNQLADGFKRYLQFIPLVKQQLTQIATGISVYGVSKNNVRNVQVRLPSRTEQTAIATVISDMDVEIHALERRRDKIKSIKQGMMQALLTGRVRLVRPPSSQEAEA